MDSSIGMNSGSDVTTLPELTSQGDSSFSNSASESQQARERTFSQSELNDIVKRAKNEAVDRDRRARDQASYGDTSPTRDHSPNDRNDDAIRKIVAEETQRQREQFEQQTRQRTEQEQAQNIVNKFWNKISTGKDKYQDFEKVTGDIEYARFPNTVQLLADHIDNASDVLYELGKDRFKMAQLESLSYLSPRDAVIQAQRLANSIKENEEASKLKLPNEPLSQMRPSTTGLGSGDSNSFRDLRMKYRG
jgi:hypothetical protein